ncbi:MAG: UDP-N-acetylmuramoyl-L-alanyl-D-glutamate--2,6-diaminopimelate ligase [Bryobacteraceae bacterium]|nr:UDP-N-acetylmuramoyl-L-alanyl-D-glutamate--2,6-diaminopimelate ligase [Bryobacteraceae bacterium]MDW8379359.1 UDP-N-acetylmuramoyl-L-alanyl-D-glutamate--2,6-diaminopimelate ligase [Bryobacterales bacterium]
MLLNQVLAGVKRRATVPLPDVEVTGLRYDSRRVGPGDLFFAFAGSRTDGANFAQQALEQGAVAIVSESPKPQSFSGLWIQVEHGRQALSLACRNLYGPPEQKLSLVGITGTNGKTTTTSLVQAVFEAAGVKSAIFGTLGNQIGGVVYETANTTPESLDLYALFAQACSAGVSHVVMEVSSHALALGRVYAIGFHSAVFTNLTQDHLDFHGTMEAYFEAKTRLFQANGASAPDWAIINWDDPYGRQIPVAEQTRRIRYGFSPEADLRASDLEMSWDGLRFTVCYQGASSSVVSPLLGQFNVYNILAALGVGLSYGFDLPIIASGIPRCRAIPGRFERIEQGQPFLLIVDYAHTDDALRNAIQLARSLKPQRVITVFGCGGDRDRAKRPLMGMAAGELSDWVIVTSDNPRSEDPLNIINDILVGLRRYDTPHEVEPDRRKAIQRAVAQAQPGDLILLAGKGHENYQIVKDQKLPFDDRQVARQVLEESGYGRQRE